MSDDQIIVEVNTIEELDNFLHGMQIEYMKNKSSFHKRVKFEFGPDLKRLGMEAINEMIIMKAAERALNDPEVKELSIDKDDEESLETFKNDILPVLQHGMKVTYH